MGGVGDFLGRLCHDVGGLGDIGGGAGDGDRVVRRRRRGVGTGGIGGEGRGEECERADTREGAENRTGHDKDLKISTRDPRMARVQGRATPSAGVVQACAGGPVGGACAAHGCAGGACGSATSAVLKTCSCAAWATLACGGRIAAIATA